MIDNKYSRKITINRRQNHIIDRINQNKINFKSFKNRFKCNNVRTHYVRIF